MDLKDGMKLATPEHLAEVERLGDPIADYLKGVPPGIAMEILLYVIVRCFLDVGLKPGTTPAMAFDKYAAAARITIEQNWLIAQREQSEAKH